MSKFLTAPQWYDAGGGLNKSLDVNCNGFDTATAFGGGANSREGGVSVGYRASSAGGLRSVAIGKDAKANLSGADCIAIGAGAVCVQNSEPSRKIQFLSRGSSVVKTNEIGFSRDSLLDLIYPIGAIYISVLSYNPGTIFGGTWEAFATGRTLVGVDANDGDFGQGATGGSKTVILTTEQMPEHRHYLNRQGAGSQSGTLDVFANTVGSAYGTVPSTSTGGGQPHDNMPPYITVYMWKRTA